PESALDLFGRRGRGKFEEVVIVLQGKLGSTGLLLEFGNVGRRQFAPALARIRLAFAQTFGGLLGRRLGAACAVRTEIPAGLQRSPAMRATAADPFAALRTRVEIDADRRAAAGAQ